MVTHLLSESPSQLQRSLALALLVAAALGPSSAHASLFGEENGPLAAIVAEVAEQIGQAAETLNQIKATYDETRKYVGMAQDAVDTFNDVKSWGESVITRPDLALGQLFPAADAMRRDLASPLSWGRGTGELQRRIRICLMKGGTCGEFSEAVTGRQAQESISTTFGTVPVGVRRDDIATVDVEAAVGIAGSTVHEGKATYKREQYDALMQRCLQGTDAQAMTACQAAANLASILQAQETADLNEQMASGNRLQAVGLAERNSEKKQALHEAQQRRQAVSDGFRDLGSLKLLPTKDLKVEEE